MSAQAYSFRQKLLLRAPWQPDVCELTICSASIPYHRQCAAFFAMTELPPPADCCVNALQVLGSLAAGQYWHD